MVDKANQTPLWNLRNMTFLSTFKGLLFWKCLITQRLAKELDVTNEKFSENSSFTTKYSKTCHISKLQCHKPGHIFANTFLAWKLQVSDAIFHNLCKLSLNLNFVLNRSTNLYHHVKTLSKVHFFVKLTGVINMQFVNDAFVATTEHHHQVLDGHSPMTMTRSRAWTRGICHFFPLKNGRRHCYMPLHFNFSK